MCSTLTDCELLNCGSADRAGFALAVVDAKIILIFTAAIDPVYTGAVAADAFAQHGADRFVQILRLFLCDVVGCGAWVQSGEVQAFVSVNIAKPGKEGLVEEQGL